MTQRRGTTMKPLHEWALTPKEAIALQRRLARRVSIPARPWSEARVRRVRIVAGVDASYGSRTERDRRCVAAVVLYDLRERRVVVEASATGEEPFPYIPGLLSFRELPVVLDAFAALDADAMARIDVVMCDGQGIAHPRRFGLACHLGLWLGVPAAGCAKSRLYGVHEAPGENAGDVMPLTDPATGERLGTVLRSKVRCRPLYVSPGHRIDHEAAVAIVRACGAGYRMPEPTRLADRLVNRLRRSRIPRKP